MELVVDDRERHVIPFLKVLLTMPFLVVKRITVGDYALIYNGKIMAVIERKTLADLAASIKDGRMDNTLKMLEVHKNTNCRVIYIIEGPAFPCLKKKFGRIPFKALQGKIDSLMFKSNIDVIKTKNQEHTADRLFGLFSSFQRYAKEGFCMSMPSGIKENKLISCTVGGTVGGAMLLLNAKHEKPIDGIHVLMLTKIKGITRKSAVVLLAKYTIHELLQNHSDENTLYNLTYTSGFKLGARGTTIHKELSSLCWKQQIRILSCITGLTENVAVLIIKSVGFANIVNCNYEKNAIANVQKTTTRKIGPALEKKIRLVFVKHVDKK
jgi:ERCC4-type nuclease